MYTTAEKIMRKYGYGYQQARLLSEEPYVRDLLKEIRELKRERIQHKRKIRTLQAVVDELKEVKQ
jgi:hypothetical protein